MVKAKEKWWGSHGGISFPHVVYSQQFSKSDLERLFQLALIIEKTLKKKKMVDWLWGNIITIMFFQPSTRTYFSFWSAALRLGARVMASENAGEFSSAAKGETLRDTALVMSDKSDAIIIRHPEIGSAGQMAKFAKVPVINGGDGPGQHPTQALLDYYMIKKQFGKIAGLKIAMVGDLLNGRTVRSLCYLLSKHENVTIYFVSPEQIKMKDDIKAHLNESNVNWFETTDLEKVAKIVGVIYQTRIQKEWFPDKAEYDAVSGIYIIKKKIVDLMPAHGIIMHPLPRVDEIQVTVDRSRKAKYFEQAAGGDYIRAALLLCQLNPAKARELLNI